MKFLFNWQYQYSFHRFLFPCVASDPALHAVGPKVFGFIRCHTDLLLSIPRLSPQSKFSHNFANSFCLQYPAGLSLATPRAPHRGVIVLRFKTRFLFNTWIDDRYPSQWCALHISVVHILLVEHCSYLEFTPDSLMTRLSRGSSSRNLEMGVRRN